MSAINGSEKLWKKKKNTATYGKPIKAVYALYVYVYNEHSYFLRMIIYFRCNAIFATHLYTKCIKAVYYVFDDRFVTYFQVFSKCHTVF
jgi:hypothetical protein